MIKLIENKFPDEDRFGPHSDLANLIKKIIQGSPSGKAVGLEGGWGIGKSTVIHFLEKTLKSGRRKKPSKIFVFNAWAHEGDELRRAFLDELITYFTQEKVLSQTDGETLQNNIWKIKESIIERTKWKPKEKTIFYVLALIFLFPLSKVLGDFGYSDWSNWIAALALLILSFAVTIPIARGIFKNVSFKQAFTEHFEFLYANKGGETLIETEKDAKKSFQEFEDRFLDIIASTKDKISNLVIVIDNIDRLDPQTAKLFWGSLAPFFDRTIRKELKEPKVWLLVPYSKNHLSKIFQGNSSQDDPGGDLATAGFIGKTFDFILRVPPLIDSDWRKYLGETLKEYIDKLADNEDEINSIVKIFDLAQSDRKKPITPREVNSFINQLILHNELAKGFWEIPIRVIASFILHKEEIEKQKILNFGNLTEISEQEIAFINEPKWKEMFASLWFGLPKEKAMQALLKDPIANALAKNNSEVLKGFEEFVGFQDVLLNVVLGINPRPKDAKASVVINFVATLAELKNLHKRIWMNLGESFFKAKDWIENISSFAKTFSKINNRLVGKAKIDFLKGVHRLLQNFPHFDDPAIAAEQWAKTAKGLGPSFKEVTIPKDDKFTLFVLMNEKDFIGVHGPDFIPENLSGSAFSILESQTFDLDPDLFIYPAMRLYSLNKNFLDDVSLEQIKTQFDQMSDINTPSLKGRILLLFLFAFFSPKQEGVQILKKNFQEAKLLHYLGKADGKDDLIPIFLVALLVAFPQANWSDNRPGQANEGIQQLTPFLEKPKDSPDTIRQVAEIFLAARRTSYLLARAAQHKPIRKLALAGLDKIWNQIAAINFDVKNLLEGDEFGESLENDFSTDEEGGIERLYKKLSDKEGFIENLAESEFSDLNLFLYLKLLKIEEVRKNKKFKNFIVSGIKSIEPNKWREHFEIEMNEDSLMYFLKKVREIYRTPKLENQARDPLVQLAKDHLSKGNEFYENFDKVFEIFWEALGANFKRSAEKEIVHALTLEHPPERKTEVFFSFDIPNFDQTNILKFSEDFTDNLDVCLRDKNVEGLKWFSVLSGHFPRVYTKAPPPSKSSIKKRIVEIINNDELEDNVKNLALQIGKNFGLRGLTLTAS